MTGSAPPPLPEANAEVRRLLAAGPPPDGNMVPLVRALAAATMIVPMHPEGGLLRMARAHVRRPGMDEQCIHAFTSHELAVRWAATLRDVRPTRMAIVPMITLCKRAIDQRVDAIDIDRGAAGYSMRFRGMIDLLSRSAFDGRTTITFEAVSVTSGMPRAMPPERMLDELRSLGRAHGLSTLAWSMAWIADAPAEMQLAYAPYPNEAFVGAVLARMNDLTRDRFVCTTHDALHNAIPPSAWRSLL